MDINKLYDKINKKWIGFLYGLSICMILISFGIIISINFTIIQVIIALWILIFNYLFYLPITIIREVYRNRDKLN